TGAQRDWPSVNFPGRLLPHTDRHRVLSLEVLKLGVWWLVLHLTNAAHSPEELPDQLVGPLAEIGPRRLPLDGFVRTRHPLVLERSVAGKAQDLEADDDLPPPNRPQDGHGQGPERDREEHRLLPHSVQGTSGRERMR